MSPNDSPEIRTFISKDAVQDGSVLDNQIYVKISDDIEEFQMYGDLWLHNILHLTFYRKPTACSRQTVNTKAECVWSSHAQQRTVPISCKMRCHCIAHTLHRSGAPQWRGRLSPRWGLFLAAGWSNWWRLWWVTACIDLLAPHLVKLSLWQNFV